MGLSFAPAVPGTVKDPGLHTAGYADHAKRLLKVRAWCLDEETHLWQEYFLVVATQFVQMPVD